MSKSGKLIGIDGGVLKQLSIYDIIDNKDVAVLSELIKKIYRNHPEAYVIELKIKLSKRGEQDEEV